MMKRIFILITCLAIAFSAHAKNEGKGKKQKDLPPGLEKKLIRTGELPPGWEKKIAKGEVLDIDLYKKCKPYKGKNKDYSLRSEAGTELLQIEHRVIRIKKDTREILDIIGI